MAKKTAPLLPSTDELLSLLGARLRLARLRRKLAAKQVAQRAGMSPMTLRSVERGGAGVTMGAYVAVMQALGVEQDVNLLAQADPLGRDLQDSRLQIQGRAARSLVRTARYTPASAQAPPAGQLRAPHGQTESPAKTLEAQGKVAGRDWLKDSGFARSDTLAGLIKRPPAKTGR